jgi:hypothetical protein
MGALTELRALILFTQSARNQPAGLSRRILFPHNDLQGASPPQKYSDLRT